MSSQQYDHTISVIEKADSPPTGYRWACTCGGRGSTDQSTEWEARRSGEKHAEKMRRRPKWGS